MASVDIKAILVYNKLKNGCKQTSMMTNDEVYF